MGWWVNFLEKIFPTDKRVPGYAKTVIVDIPAEIYYAELAVHTAVSMISNAISRAEKKTFIGGKPVKNRDYYLLNFAPNNNETASIFWHRAINKMVRYGEALIVEAGGRLYVADSYGRREERPVKGDIFENVTIGNFAFSRPFNASDVYLLKLDDVSVKALIDGLYAEYGKVLATAAKAFQQTNSTKYVLHVEGTKAGDNEFNNEFKNFITKQLKAYMQAENAVYPEFDGYKLSQDPANGPPRSSEDFLKLRQDLFKMVASAFHIPHSMIEGNITNFRDVVGSFLSFGIDPYADTITKALNKRGGSDNFVAGNYYKVDTSRIMHRDILEAAADISNLISSGTKSIDEVREAIGDEPLNTPWSRAHYITKNFETLGDPYGEGGE